MIKGYCKARNIEKAFEVLEIMKNKAIQPDEVLFNSLLDGCCKCNENELALKVFANMNA